MKRFIQIGTGGFGAYWCHTFLPNIINDNEAKGLKKIAQCVAAVDINPANHKNAIDNLGITADKCYTNARQAFEENEADFAIIVVPPAFHEQMVDLALEFNCDILSEKPISDTMEACVRIYKKVTQAGKKMAVTMSHRFDQDKRTLESLIKSGAYGDCSYIIGRFCHHSRHYGSWGEFRYNIDDPLLIEGTVHHFDIIRGLTGSNCKTVYTNSWNPPWSEFKGHATALINMVMENGIRVFYEGSKANATHRNGWTGEYFRAECDKASLILGGRKVVAESHLGHPYPTKAEIPLIEQPLWHNPWLAQLFVNWLNGDPAPENRLEDNIQLCALLFAAIRSAHTDQVVNVQDFLQEYMEKVTI